MIDWNCDFNKFNSKFPRIKDWYIQNKVTLVIEIITCYLNWNLELHIINKYLEEEKYFW